jgi:hypothetical protein
VSGTRHDVDSAYAEKTIARMVAPMARTGSVDAAEVTYQVHEAIVPMKYNRAREAGRMHEALGILAEAKEKLRRVGAADFHDLARYHSAEHAHGCGVHLHGRPDARGEPRPTLPRRFPRP